VTEFITPLVMLSGWIMAIVKKYSNKLKLVHNKLQVSS